MRLAALVALTRHGTNSVQVQNVVNVILVVAIAVLLLVAVAKLLGAAVAVRASWVGCLIAAAILFVAWVIW